MVNNLEYRSSSLILMVADAMEEDGTLMFRFSTSMCTEKYSKSSVSSLLMMEIKVQARAPTALPTGIDRIVVVGL